MADMKMVCVVQDSPSSTGNQSFTSSGFGTPVAAIFIVTKASSTGTHADDAILSIGMTDFSTEIVRCVGAQHNQSRAQAESVGSASYCIWLESPDSKTGAILQASENDTVTDGISITWATTASGYKVHCYLIGGDGASLEVATIPSAENAYDTLTPGFEAKCVFGLYGEIGSVSADGYLSFGFCSNDGASGISQGNFQWSENDNSDPSDCSAHIYSGYVLDTPGYAPYIALVELTTFTSTTFRAYQRSAFGDATTVYFLSIYGDNECEVNIETLPTSTGSWEVSSVGFTPDHAFGFVSESSGGSAMKASVGIVWWDGTNAYTIQACSDDNVTTSDCSSVCHAAIDVDVVDASTGYFAATHTSWDNDGFTLDTGPVPDDTNGRLLHLTFEASSSEQNATAGYVASSLSLHAPSAQLDQTAVAGYITSGATLHDPPQPGVGSVTATAGYITSTLSLHDPPAPAIVATAGKYGPFTTTYDPPQPTTGAVTATAGYIASVSTAHDATATPEASEATAGYIASTAALHAPSASGVITATAGYIASTLALHDPPKPATGAVTATAEHIASTATTYDPPAPSTSVTATAEYLASTLALHDPPQPTTGSVTATAEYVAKTSVLHDPPQPGVGAVTATAEHVDTTIVPYDASASLTAGDQNATAGYITSTLVLHDPPQPGVGSVTATAEHVDSTIVTYDPPQPAVGAVTATARYVDSTIVPYNASALLWDTHATAGYRASTLQLFDPPQPTTGAVTAIAGYKASTLSLYPPDALPGSIPAVAGYITSSSSVFDAIGSAGAVTIGVDFIASSLALYDPTASPGSISATAEYISSSLALYDPSASTGLIGICGYITSTLSLYAPTATVGEAPADDGGAYFAMVHAGLVTPPSKW